MRRRRFTREDWIMLGHARLAAEGPEAVKLEAICKAAGLTRGSFYHHFDDHETFLVALAQIWLETQTEAIAESLDSAASAANRMESLTTAAMSIDYRLELGIRELARRLPDVQRIVSRADALRLDLLADLYRGRFGLGDEAARSFAYLEYAAFSGLILLDPDMPQDRQMSLASLYAETIAKALGPEDQP